MNNHRPIAFSCRAFVVAPCHSAQSQQTSTTMMHTQPADQTRREQGNQVIDKLSWRRANSVRSMPGAKTSPFLADAIVDYSR